MGKFSDLTTLERDILLEYIQSGIKPSGDEIEISDKLDIIIKKLSTSVLRSRFPEKDLKDGESTSMKSRIVDDIIDGIPDKSGTLLLVIPSLKTKSILTEYSTIGGLPAYVSSVTIDGVSQKLFVYLATVKDGSYYVVDNDTNPKITLYRQEDLDLGTPLGSYVGEDREEGASIVSIGKK